MHPGEIPTLATTSAPRVSAGRECGHIGPELRPWVRPYLYELNEGPFLVGEGKDRRMVANNRDFILDFYFYLNLTKSQWVSQREKVVVHSLKRKRKMTIAGWWLVTPI